MHPTSQQYRPQASSFIVTLLAFFSVAFLLALIDRDLLWTCHWFLQYPNLWQSSVTGVALGSLSPSKTSRWLFNAQISSLSFAVTRDAGTGLSAWKDKIFKLTTNSRKTAVDRTRIDMDSHVHINPRIEAAKRPRSEKVEYELRAEEYVWGRRSVKCQAKVQGTLVNEDFVS
ncbi:hypothetical protein K503DRAFT_787510 [Rhizopogon vinicolor AM-OR11-026]|uniref:Uncharacterized protein n=1 Tax=Rhizopogon vinicolor AM-OR11-026 TaxID=1314800 RepID=A0A1B7MH96_9AGAM|nr:hypothetical protein K503DRAFT_787510 [Rhizopogon vinicolor AM-OR11-026]